MQVYPREGQERAMALGNRGPIRFDAAGIPVSGADDRRRRRGPGDRIQLPARRSGSAADPDRTRGTEPRTRSNSTNAGNSRQMDGKGRWVDNVFVERLWRSVKYEEVHLHACEGVAAARAGLGRCFRFYNAEHRHQGLGRRTPDEVYSSSGSWPKAA